MDVIEGYEGKKFTSKARWESFLKKRKIYSKNARKIITEAALVGGIIYLGINLDLPIMSDAAPQFVLFINGLCWIHEERHYRKLIPVSEFERIEIDKIRSEIWDFYEELKAYKLKPNQKQQIELSKRFDEIFGKEYQSESIKTLLANTRSRKKELLLVLRLPFLPLHNNDCERDIREYTKRRKISGSTRSEAGRRSRDTFTSLKKTCKKHKIAFWNYITDRLKCINNIPRLSELIKHKAQTV